MKKYKMFLLVLTFITSFAFSKDLCNEKKGICCKNIKQDPLAFYYPKNINLACPNNFYISGEFLIMQVKEEGLEYAMTQTTTDAGNPNIFPLTGGDIQGYSTGHHNWNWTYGCRANIGFYLNEDSWNVEGTWTYIRINNDSGTNVSGGVLLPLWLPPMLRTESDNISSSARWTGHLNTFDLKMGKPHHISRYVIFNPHFGIRLAWIDQDFTVRNGGLFEKIPPGPLLDENLKMIAKNDFWGIGPKAGIDSEWNFGNNFCFFGKIATSLLYSHFDVNQSLAFGNMPLYQLKHDFYTNSSNMEIILGFSFAKSFNKNKSMLSLKAAYEMQKWWELNRLRKFFDKDRESNIIILLFNASAPSSNDEVARGDLSVNGFSFAIQLDF